MITNTSYILKAGHTMTVSVVDGSAHVQQQESASIAARVTNAGAAVFGPYMLDRHFRVQDSGNATVTIAEADVSANVPSADEKALLDNIPTEDPADDGVSIWNDEGALKVSGASA